MSDINNVLNEDYPLHYCSQYELKQKFGLKYSKKSTTRVWHQRITVFVHLPKIKQQGDKVVHKSRNDSTIIRWSTRLDL